MDEIRYDVSLSFAGEQRDYVRRVAEDLQYRGLRVFYDENEEDQLWGKNLLDYLSDLYLKKCRYCIIFASAEYTNKMWPQERASLFTTVKVVFDAGERPCAQLTIVARDPEGNSVGEYSGWFTDSGVVKPPPARRSGSVAGVTGACVCDGWGLNWLGVG